MKTNWLWDSHLGESKVRKILKDANNPKFNLKPLSSIIIGSKL